MITINIEISFPAFGHIDDIEARLENIVRVLLNLDNFDYHSGFRLDPVGGWINATVTPAAKHPLEV